MVTDCLLSPTYLAAQVPLFHDKSKQFMAYLVSFFKLEFYGPGDIIMEVRHRLVHRSNTRELGVGKISIACLYGCCPSFMHLSPLR